MHFRHSCIYFLDSLFDRIANKLLGLETVFCEGVTSLLLIGALSHRAPAVNPV